MVLDNYHDKIRTYITHNKGGSWDLIKAPETDLRGKPTSCFIEDGCSLNLHIYSNQRHSFAPPYSQ